MNCLGQTGSLPTDKKIKTVRVPSHVSIFNGAPSQQFLDAANAKSRLIQGRQFQRHDLWQLSRLKPSG